MMLTSRESVALSEKATTASLEIDDLPAFTGKHSVRR